MPAKTLTAALSACAALLSAAPALAHHSFAMFDMDNEKTVSGTVTDFQWANPHSWIYVKALSPTGEQETWGVEGMSPSFLERRGWTRTMIKPGDKVTLVFHPTRSGGKGGAFVSVTLPDGRKFDQLGNRTLEQIAEKVGAR
jgi:hypothetical protein